jgi:hypothetical protein
MKGMIETGFRRNKLDASVKGNIVSNLLKNTQKIFFYQKEG